MADEPTSELTNTPAADVADPKLGDDATDDAYDPERAKATIRSLRAKLRETEEGRRSENVDRDNRRLAKQLAEAQAKLREHEEAGMTEAEKAKARAESAEKRASELEARLQAAETARDVERRTSRITRIAAGMGAHDPADPNFLQVTASLEAEASDQQITQALEGLKKNKAYLFKQPGQSLASFNPGETTPTVAKETDAERRLRLMAGGGRVPGIFDPRPGAVVIAHDLNEPIPK